MRERVVLEPNLESFDVDGHHPGAQALEARRVLREHLDASARPQREKSLDRDLKHCRVPMVQEMMRIRLDEDPRALFHSSSIVART
jgi:hypothetical protein